MGFFGVQTDSWMCLNQQISSPNGGWLHGDESHGSLETTKSKDSMLQHYALLGETVKIRQRKLIHSEDPKDTYELPLQGGAPYI